MANPVNQIDFTKTLAAFLATAVDNGTWADILNELKFDNPGEEGNATDVDAATLQLWGNVIDDFLQAVWPYLYKATKFWGAADDAERDGLGSDDSLAVDDIIYVRDSHSLWYCVSVDGAAASTWSAIGGSGTGAAPGPRWEFDAGTADADPGAGKFRYNNATQNVATFMYVNDDTCDGENMARPWFSELTVNDDLLVQEEGTPTRIRRWAITGPVTLAAGYFKIPIAPPPGTNPGGDLVAPGKVKITIASPTGGLGKILQRGNSTSGKDILLSGLDAIVADPVPLRSDDPDTTPVLRLTCAGANGEEANIFVGDRNPIGSVTGEPGDLYIRDDEDDSRLYFHRGQAPDNLEWKEIAFLSEVTTPGLAAVLAVDNDTGPNNIEIALGQDIRSAVATEGVRTKTTGGDNIAPLIPETLGTNGAQVALRVGNRTPVGNVSSQAGHFYFRVDAGDDEDSDLYINLETGFTSSGWQNVSKRIGQFVFTSDDNIAAADDVFPWQWVAADSFLPLETRASIKTTSASDLEIDILDDGVSIFTSGFLTISSGGNTGTKTPAATPIAKDSKLTVNIEAGSAGDWDGLTISVQGRSITV